MSQKQPGNERLNPEINLDLIAEIKLMAHTSSLATIASKPRLPIDFFNGYKLITSFLKTFL